MLQDVVWNENQQRGLPVPLVKWPVGSIFDRGEGVGEGGLSLSFCRVTTESTSITNLSPILGQESSGSWFRDLAPAYFG